MGALNIILALEASMRLMAQAQAYTQLVLKARAENRSISDEELDGLRKLDDEARKAESAAIAAARQGT